MKLRLSLIFLLISLVSLAQSDDRKLHAYCGIRPIRNNLVLGLKYDISKKYSLGPEIVYGVKNNWDNVYDDGLFLGGIHNNLYIMEKSISIGISSKIQLEDANLYITPFYLEGSNKNGIYNYVDTNYGSWPYTTFRGGDLSFQYIGLELLCGKKILETQLLDIEFNAGASIFNKQVVITYDTKKLDDEYSSVPSHVVERTNEAILNKNSIALQASMILIF